MAGWQKLKRILRRRIGFGAAGAMRNQEYLARHGSRGRVGYAADRVLFYGTAGGAFGNIEPAPMAGSSSRPKAGWTAGAGVEVAFADNWTARVEYLLSTCKMAPAATANPCGNGPGTRSREPDCQIRRQPDPARRGLQVPLNELAILSGGSGAQ